MFLALDFVKGFVKGGTGVRARFPAQFLIRMGRAGLGGQRFLFF